MTNTLIIFGTRGGATKKSAEIIKDVLEKEYKQEIDIYNAKEIPPELNMDNYSNVVVGSSIQATLWARKAKNFLKRKELSGKKIAVFVSAAGTLDGEGKEPKEGGPEKTKEQVIDKALNHYVNKFLAKHEHLNVVAKTALGGWMKIMGGNEPTLDNWNEEDFIGCTQKVKK